MSIQITKLSALEIPLANKFYKLNKARGSAKRGEQVWVLRNPDIIAACRIQVVEEKLLLVGLMVSESERSKGTGKKLITEVMGYQTDYVYTFPYAGLKQWYSDLGFEIISEALVCEPIKIKWNTYRAQGRDILIMRK